MSEQQQAELNAPASPAEMAELLTGLRELHQPAPIGWWPPAPGWWFLLLGAALMLAYLLWRRHQRHATRRLGRRALAAAYRAWHDHQSDARYLSEVNIALRRIALTVRPRRDVCALTGTPWINALNALSTHRFTKQSATALSLVAYQCDPQWPVPALHQELMKWSSHLQRDNHA